jgi:hypothetical protein
VIVAQAVPPAGPRSSFRFQARISRRDRKRSLTNGLGSGRFRAGLPGLGMTGGALAVSVSETTGAHTLPSVSPRTPRTKRIWW